MTPPATHRDASLETLRQLLRASRDGHDAVQQIVADAFSDLGIPVQVLQLPGPSAETTDPPHERTCVLAQLGPDSGGVLFFAHSDSEPVDTTQWTVDPYDGIERDGRFHGWGVGDDLAGIAAMLATARNLVHADGGPPATRVAFASVPSKRKARGIVHALEHVGGGWDASVYLHPAESGIGLGEIKVASSGLLRFTITVHGRKPPTQEPGHTVFAHLACDPVQRATELAQQLYALGKDRAERIDYAPIRDAIGRSTNLHVGAIHGGDPARSSQIPTHVHLHGSLTFPPDEPIETPMNDIADVIARHALQSPWQDERPHDLTWTFAEPGAATDLDDPVYVATQEAIRTVTGRSPQPNVLHAASDIRLPRLACGAPTIGIGPQVGNLTVNGAVDEYVTVESFLQTIDVAERIARTDLRKPEPPSEV